MGALSTRVLAGPAHPIRSKYCHESVGSMGHLRPYADRHIQFAHYARCLRVRRALHRLLWGLEVADQGG